MKLLDKAKKGAKYLFGTPEGLSPQEEAEFKQNRSDALNSSFEGLVDLFTNQMKESQPIKYTPSAGPGDLSISMQSGEYKPLEGISLLKTPRKKIQGFTTPDSTQLLSLAKANEMNPVRPILRQGEIWERANYNMTPTLGDDPIVVQEGMAERAVSDFGVFRQGSRNRIGLLQRRNNAQAERARLLGDRG